MLKRRLVRHHYMRKLLCSLGIGIILALWMRPAFAHNGGAYTVWGLDLVTVLPLLLLVVAYNVSQRRLQHRAPYSITPARVWAFYGGVAVVLLALMSPTGVFADELLTAHMIQHLLLVLLAPPLLVWARPLVPLLWALPQHVRVAGGRYYARQHGLRGVVGWLMHPVTVWLVHVGTLWLWHLPSWYQAGLRSEPIHIAQHATFFLSALLFWWVVIHPLPSRRTLGYGWTLFYIFVTMLQSALLGVLLTFSPTLWYPYYEYAARPWGLSALNDQEIAGLIMWIPAGLLYMGAMMAVLVTWMQGEARRAKARQADNAPVTVQRSARSNARTVSVAAPASLAMLFAALWLWNGIGATRANSIPVAAPTQDVNGLRVALQVEREAQNPWRVGVWVQDGAGRPAEVRNVRVEFAMPYICTTELALTPPALGNGYFQDEATSFTMSGTWLAKVTVERSNQQEVQTQFAVPVTVAEEATLQAPTGVVGDAQLAAGQRLYAANCASCHGLSGRGDGPGSAELTPPPSDFADHMRPGKHTDPQVFLAIHQGLRGSAMRSYKDELTADEIWQLVAYLRTFAPPAPQP
jgi:putative membrane protein